MLPASTLPEEPEFVPDDRIPSHSLPAPRYLDLPEAPHWTALIGPGVILAGLALGSGEYILWPNIVCRSGFVFMWAALVGIVTQFFINMEIERWTLATGESAVTGFCRLHAVWAPVFLVLNIVPWAWPGWGTGAAQLMARLAWGETFSNAVVNWLAVATLMLCGVVLTAGPVIYKTMEQIQFFLVATILVLVAMIAVVVVRWDALAALGQSLLQPGTMPSLSSSKLSMAELLGALAFAGAGGTLNLGQSLYVRDKGYGMGKFVGRLTSPLTGQDEAVTGVGYLFRPTAANESRWRSWWWAANVEHFWSFGMTCVVCLLMLALVAYSLVFDRSGSAVVSIEQLGSGFSFVNGLANLLRLQPYGDVLRVCYLMAGVAILLTTELGVLDATSRISADILKVNFFLESSRLSTSRLYFLCLWLEIVFGIVILTTVSNEPAYLIRMSAAMNGGVMFLYSLLLLYMNNAVLPRNISMSAARFVVMVWASTFYGYFTLAALLELKRAYLG